MIDQKRYFERKPARSSIELSPFAWLFYLIRQLFKKKSAHHLGQLSAWEREKAVKLGLAVNSSTQNRHQKSHAAVKPWRNEKAHAFELSGFTSTKKTPKNYCRSKKTAFQINRAERFDWRNPAQLKEPKIFKLATEVDDFLKILGYE